MISSKKELHSALVCWDVELSLNITSVVLCLDICFLVVGFVFIAVYHVFLVCSIYNKLSCILLPKSNYADYTLCSITLSTKICVKCHLCGFLVFQPQLSIICIELYYYKTLIVWRMCGVLLFAGDSVKYFLATSLCLCGNSLKEAVTDMWGHLCTTVLARKYGTVNLFLINIYRFTCINENVQCI